MARQRKSLNTRLLRELTTARKRDMQINSFSDVNLGIVCPMANESDNAESFVGDVLNVCKQFDFQSIKMYTIFDNKCTDGTYSLLKGVAPGLPELVVIFAPENRSVVDAYLRGYREALKDNRDWILEIDAGYSHQPTDIPQFFTKMKEGYACVFGSRFCRGAKVTDRVLKRYLIALGGTLLTNFLLKTRLTDMTGGFELFPDGSHETNVRLENEGAGRDVGMRGDRQEKPDKNPAPVF